MKLSVQLVFMLVALLSSCAVLALHADDRSQPGWGDEVAREEDTGDGTGTKRWLEVLSWPSRVFHLHNFLTPEECDHLIENAKPRLTRSSVVDTKSGGGQVSKIRTSNGMFFRRGETPTISAIEERIAQWIMLDKSQGEGFQVLDYKESQKYDPHFDYFFHESGNKNGGNRIATMLLYLTDVEEGGETVFPHVPVPPTQTNATFSECAMQGLAVKPRRGNAVVFWSLTTAGTLNPGALHGGCPVIKGEKYSATKWYHVAPYAVEGEAAHAVDHIVYAPLPPPAPPGCTDSQYACQGWASSGECWSNPVYMVGTAERPGNCLLSCQRCDLMPRRPAKPLGM